MQPPSKDTKSALNDNPEAQLGGADAVEKTTFVVGRGTDPEAQRGDGPAATVRSRAPVAVGVVVAILVALVVLAYLLGLGAGS